MQETKRFYRRKANEVNGKQEENMHNEKEIIV